MAEWQIEAVKKSAKTLKDEEVDHSEMAPAEKENQKRLWKLLLDTTTQGFKDKLKEEGRLV